MADDDLKPMTGGDITPPPATTDFQPAVPLKNAGVEFDADGGSASEDLRQKIKDGTQKYGTDVADRARALADTGKTKATDALGQLSSLLGDAATQVDDKLGAQYGNYARNAATSVQGFADQIQAKDVDELIGDARAFVQKSPAIAIGIAAAVGFALARVVQSGIDGNKA